jgi:predicted cobalt transporter CbtA
MTRTLLLRGMLAGIIAGLLVFGFARWIGEPQIEQAIVYENGIEKAKGEAPEPEMVARRTQSNLGLLVGVDVYGTAIGGLFGLVFAYTYGRSSVARSRVLSALLAGIGFVTVVLVPNLKYPANPPSVGNPDTIGVRTAAFFLLIALSIVSMVLAIKIRRYFSTRYGTWNSSLLAVVFFVIFMSIVFRFLPEIDEVPAGFPVTLMWRFRIAALEIQAVLWATLGLLFGWLTERYERRVQSRLSNPQ